MRTHVLCRFYWFLFFFLYLLTASEVFGEPGDINGDLKVDLVDSIIALGLLVNAENGAGNPINADGDVGTDGKIGLQEVLFILRKVSLDDLQPRVLNSTITKVQPMTGIVLWSDSEHNLTDSIQLEYSYIGFDSMVTGQNTYNWNGVDTLLNDVAARGHQAILRFYFVYPGRATTVPAYIKAIPEYSETRGTSEGKVTWFPDWTSADLQDMVLNFYSAFATRYDDDPRLAFLQVGFGLWGEYHIYDGPMELGVTFPDRGFQSDFLSHLANSFTSLKWSLSIDAAEVERSPFGQTPDLLNLSFGLFDDSFLHSEHHEYNADCFNFFSFQTRYSHAPMGGELSYYSDHDQQTALDPTGPHGISFEQMASQYHISYMIGNDQPDYQSMERIRESGMATGYRFRFVSFESSETSSMGVIKNEGIAPIYYDAYVAVNSIRSEQTLKGLLPGQFLEFSCPSGGSAPIVTIESDRLVAGQIIGYEAELVP